MLPGKTPTPEDLLRMVRRRAWLLIVPVALATAATALYVRQIPDLYQSYSLIMVVGQRVPEAYVKSTVTQGPEDRIRSMRHQITSRTRLEKIITEFDLYPEERQSQIMEDVVVAMRNDIGIDQPQRDVFRVTYTGKEPRTTMQVTDRLADLFREENMLDRGLQAEGTNNFLENQMAEMRRKLKDLEDRQAAYKAAHSGELPTQLESNLQVMQSTASSLQNLAEGLNRDRETKLLYQRQLADEQAEAAQAANAAPLAQNAAGEPAGTTAQQLHYARISLAALEERYKPEHPEISFAKRRIRDLEKKAEAEELDAVVSDTTALGRAVTPAEAARKRRVSELNSQLEALERQMAQKEQETQRLRGVLNDYQRRVENVPARESELVELTRDYQTTQAQYASLLAKNMDARLSANLERQQIGEQFKLLDPARLPERPVYPNRPRLTLIGVAIGLAIGVLLAAFLEYRDTTFRVDDEVTSVLSLPVLAVVPMMLADSERLALRRRRMLLGAGLTTTTLACAAVVVYTIVR